jgi:uncharacterized protein YcnI
LRIGTLISIAVAALLAAPAATAHVTMNPGEWEAGGFARFAVRVPNERDDAAVTRVRVQFPENVVQASFQPVPGWSRTVTMAPLAAPLEEEGEEPITERLATVTWTGRLAPGEFQEFGVSFQVPEDAAGSELLFPTLQTYSSGEVSRWISPEVEADEPAPRVVVLPAAEEAAAPATTTEATPEAGESQAAGAGADGDEGNGRANLALGFGVGGLVVGLAALGLALLRRPRTA